MRGHAYLSHIASAAISMMTVSADKSRSHEFMPKNGRKVAKKCWSTSDRGIYLGTPELLNEGPSGWPDR
jgi:hypothetical protein